MIIKNYQLENKNIIKHNFFLFYGDNEGLKNDKIKDVSTKLKLIKIKKSMGWCDDVQNKNKYKGMLQIFFLY